MSLTKYTIFGTEMYALSATTVFTGCLAILSNYLIVHVTFVDAQLLKTKSNFLIGIYALHKIGHALGILLVFFYI